MEKLATGLIIRKDPKSLGQQQLYAPITFDALRVLPAVKLSHHWIDIMKILSTKVKACYSVPQYNLGPSGDSIQSYSFFLLWLALCKREYYQKDIKRKTTKGNNCNKAFTGHPNLMPGIFTVYCQQSNTSFGRVVKSV